MDSQSRSSKSHPTDESHYPQKDSQNTTLSRISKEFLSGSDTATILASGLDEDHENDIDFSSIDDANFDGQIDQNDSELKMIRRWFFNQSEFRYILGDIIGRGGAGEVWGGKQSLLQRQIAAKRPLFSWLTEASRAMQGKVSKRPPNNIVRSQGGKLRSFVREAMIGAVLEHPNIVPIYDLGKDMDGTPLIIMRRVFGRTWNSAIEKDWERLSVEDFLSRHISILIRVSNAVAYAHSRGIIHRDLKPTQVMLGEYGEVQLMDWGLALVMDPDQLQPKWKPSETPLPPTKVGILNPAGTPAYMAPEQTEENAEHLGPWTDLFLLGGMLYYLLTGRQPYASNSAEIALVKAMEGKPPPVDEAAQGRHVPQDLAQLVNRTLIKDWRERGMTAVEFIRALESFLLGYSKRKESEEILKDVEQLLREGEESYKTFTRALNLLSTARGLWAGNPLHDQLQDKVRKAYAILALSHGDLTLARLQSQALDDDVARKLLLARVAEAEARSTRRDRQRHLAFTGMGVLLVLLASASVVALTQWIRATGEVERSRVAEVIAYEAEAASRLSQLDALNALKKAEIESYFSSMGFVASAIRDGNPERASEVLHQTLPAYRNWEWGATMARLNDDDVTLMTGTVNRERAMFHSAVSPDGKELAVAQQGGWVSFWDLETLEISRELQFPTRGAWCVDYHPNGDRILVSGLDGTALVADVKTGYIFFRLHYFLSEGFPTFLRNAFWSPDGSRIASSGSTTPIAVYSGIDGILLAERRLPFGSFDITWSPDGTRLLVGSLGQERILIVDANTLETLVELEVSNSREASVSWSPTGDMAAYVTLSGPSTIFNPDTGETLHLINPLNDYARAVTFSPDGSRLALSTRNGIVHLYDTRKGSIIQSLHGAHQMYKIGFHHDRDILIGTAFDTLKAWNLERIGIRRISHGETDSLAVTRLDKLHLPSFPLQRLAAWRHYDEAWYLGDHDEHFFQWGERALEIVLKDVFHSPCRKMRGEFGYADRKLAISDTETGEIIWEPPTSLGEIVTAIFSPNGEYLLLSLRHGGTVAFVNVKDWTIDETPHKYWTMGTGAVFSFSFSRSGRLMGLGFGEGELVVVDLATREAILQVVDHVGVPKAIIGMAFSGDETLVATASSNNEGAIFDLTTGELVSRLLGHNLNMLSIDLSPDNTRALTVGMDDRARIWDVATGREIMILHASNDLNTRLMAGAFSSDGEVAFIANSKGLIQIFDTLPWVDSKSFTICGSGRSPQWCVERMKRDLRLPPLAAAAPILW